ncbi:MAG: MoxR family ATPase [Candidatus Obscuribacterales bacterium]|nr:MoxR family ATPase [Candidatus Obscuribacterales bacterium]
MPTIKNPKLALLRDNLDLRISGNRHVKEQVINALLADGHILVTSIPGTGKTTLVEALQDSIADSTSGVMQLTPDVKPSDILGSRVWDREKNAFVVVPGPIVGKNIFLPDEINRTPGKTLAAILRPMQERKVTIADKEFLQPELFLVFATRNPIEQEGTYPLPEAALDRFSVEVTMDYVSRKDALQMLRRRKKAVLQHVISVSEILAARAEVMSIADNVSDSALEYIVDISRATRPSDESFARVHGNEAKSLSESIKLGASPRAEIAMRDFAAARAYCNDRDTISDDDVKAVARDVLRHRIILNPAVMNDMTVDSFVSKILDRVKPIEVRSNRK